MHTTTSITMCYSHNYHVYVVCGLYHWNVSYEGTYNFERRRRMALERICILYTLLQGNFIVFFPFVHVYFFFLFSLTHFLLAVQALHWFMLFELFFSLFANGFTFRFFLFEILSHSFIVYVVYTFCTFFFFVYLKNLFYMHKIIFYFFI